MKSSLSEADQAELARLLTLVHEQDGGYVPDSCFKPLHRIAPMPSVEVVIYDPSQGFVLTYRDDEDFKGLHIPGGYMRSNENFQQACDRHVQKDNIADGVTNLRQIATHVWTNGEHPYGTPVSIYFVCEPVGEVRVSKTCNWYRDIPSDMIQQHQPKFLAFFKEAQEPRLGCHPVNPFLPPSPATILKIVAFLFKRFSLQEVER